MDTQRLTLARGRQFAATATGQFLGAGLTTAPVLVSPMSLHGIALLVVWLLAAGAGFVGNLLLVGGLAVRMGWLASQQL